MDFETGVNWARLIPKGNKEGKLRIFANISLVSQKQLPLQIKVCMYKLLSLQLKSSHLLLLPIKIFKT